ncbi:MAG: hypothetical protein JW726_00570 [Anaerolineales bacterium]|nr:hypothetical protein [Anaerolineales bacterium]
MLEAPLGAGGTLTRSACRPPPIETPQGWLVIYHWVFGPEEAYEQRGDVGYITFPCGYALTSNGDTVQLLYYGAADTSLALASGSVRAILEWLEQYS